MLIPYTHHLLTNQNLPLLLIFSWFSLPPLLFGIRIRILQKLYWRLFYHNMGTQVLTLGPLNFSIIRRRMLQPMQNFAPFGHGQHNEILPAKVWNIQLSFLLHDQITDNFKKYEEMCTNQKVDNKQAMLVLSSAGFWFCSLWFHSSVVHGP